MDQINDTLIKVAGLDENMEGGDSGDEGEAGDREDYDAAPTATGNAPRNSVSAAHQPMLAPGAAGGPQPRMSAALLGRVTSRGGSRTPQLGL